MAEIRCDTDYMNILPNKMFDDLAISVGKIDHMRDKAEDRMWRMTMCHDCGIFYPYSDKKAVEELVEAVRQKAREAADKRKVVKPDEEE